MKKQHLIVLVCILLSFVTNTFAQRGNYRITNGIGVFGGVTKNQILTNNFITETTDGFIGGFFATVDIPQRAYNISFSMQLSESAVHILGRPSIVNTNQELIDYKLFAAQVAMLAHVKLVDNYFTIDAGPMLQYNGKLELKDSNQENFYINNYLNLKASDIENISQFNINATIGATAGPKYFKIKAQYIYGFTNILRKLNNEGLDTSGGDNRFKGNQSMLVFGAMITF